jgi:hypothetical protein
MDLTNYLRKDYATPSIYYGYSIDPNAASTDFNWSIRKVTTATNVETVTWSNGDPGKPYTKWNDRVASFATPTGSLGLTCSTDGLSLYVNWNQLAGVDNYQFVVSSNNIIYSDLGTQLYDNPNFNSSQITKTVVNSGSYAYRYASAGNTYTVTLSAVNVIGASSSTVTITIE